MEPIQGRVNSAAHKIPKKLTSPRMLTTRSPITGPERASAVLANAIESLRAQHLYRMSSRIAPSMPSIVKGNIRPPTSCRIIPTEGVDRQ
jgi:hypothetical protein